LNNPVLWLNTICPKDNFNAYNIGTFVLTLVLYRFSGVIILLSDNILKNNESIIVEDIS